MKKTLLAALAALFAPLAGAQLPGPRVGLSPAAPPALSLSTATFRAAASRRIPAAPFGMRPKSLAGMPDRRQAPGTLDAGRLDGLFDGSAKKGGDWELRFSFGPVRTGYFNTDIKVKSSKIEGTFKDAQLSERHGMHNYAFWDKSKVNNPFNWIDEPTNRYLLTAENKKRRYAVSLSVTHPKVLVVDEGKVNQAVRFQGTIEGAPVDREIRINDYFSHWMMTYGLMDISAQFEKTLPLFKGKLGALDYAPGLGAGAVTSSSHVSYRVPGTLGDPVPYDQPVTFIGYSGTLSNRLTYTLPNGRFNASVSHSLTGSRLRYPFMDGWAEQDLNYQTLWFGLGARLYQTKKPSDGP